MKCLFDVSILKKGLMTCLALAIMANIMMAENLKISPGVPVHLFTIDQAQELNWKALRSNKDVRIFTYDAAVYHYIKTQKPALLNMMVPTIDGDLEVELIENHVLSEDFVLSSDKQRNIAYTPGRFYKGKVKGIDSSFVAMSFFDHEVYGVISMPDHGNLVIGSSPALRSNTFMLFNEADVPAPSFGCLSDELPGWTTQVNKIKGSLRSSPDAAKCINVYFEAGNNVFSSKGGETGAADFISGIFNGSVSIYSSESVTTSISEVKVWTTPEPYNISAGTALNDFGNALGGNFNGNIAHFVRLNTGSFSGIAWVDALCSNVPYAYSEVASSYSAYPAYSWNVNVVTHEMGHNLGSPHTHACSWPGGPIDNCYSPEGSCSPGPSPGAGGGTIMSYCHLVNSIGIKFSNGFGTLPGNKIRASINSATCLGSCGSSGGGGGGGGTTSPPDLQTTSVTVSPSTLTTLSQSTTIAFITGNLGANAGASTSRVYFSTDNNLSSGDATVADVSLPAINASSSVTASFGYNLPSNTTAGTYYIIVCADVSNTVAESVESNNCKSVALVFNPNSNPNPTPTPTTNLPDLSINVSSSMPSVITPGMNISLSGTVNNIGDASAGASSLSVVLSSDNFYSGNDVSLYNTPIPALSVSSSNNFSNNLTIPSSLSLNNYYIIVCADAANAINEKNEGNNCTSYAVNVNIPSPDIVIFGVKLSSNPVPTGNPFVVNYSRQNTGSVASGSYSVGVYLSKTNNTLEATDQLLGEQNFSGEADVSAVNPEQFQVTAKLDPGNYYILVCGDNKNKVTESNEANNCASVAINISNPIPDLVLEILNTPGEILLNQKLNISVRVRNSGLKKSDVPTTAALYFSNSNSIEKTSTLVGIVNVPALDINAYTDTIFSLTLTDESLEGDHFLAYCVDQSNKVTESNESNNCNASALRVTIPLADLASITNANFSKEVPKGGVIKFPLRVTNIGRLEAPASATEFYLSSKPFIKSGGVRFNLDTLGNLKIGDTARKDISLPLPSSVAPGQYYLNICVDYNNKIKESNKSNNCQSIRLTIRKQYPDLDITALTLQDPILYGGIKAGIRLSVKNIGEIIAVKPRITLIGYINNSKDTIRISDFMLDSLSAGASLDTTIGFAFNANLAGKQIVIKVVADPGGLIDEYDENNNTEIVTRTVSSPLPDLIPSALLVSDTLLHSGKEYILNALLTNMGVAPSDSFKMNVTLTDSAGKTLVALVSDKVSGIGIAALDTVVNIIKVPSAIFSGDYTLKLVLDPDKNIAEIDKSNNTITTPVKILHTLPDVDAEQLFVSDSISKGSTAPVTVVIKNIGEGFMPQSTNQILLVRNLADQSESHVIGNLVLPALESEQSIELKSMVQIPAGLATDTYQIKVVLNDPQVTEEADHTNNTIEHPVVIPDTKTDLDHTGIQLINGAITRQGEILKLNHFVKNDGETPAGSFAISYMIMHRKSDINPEYVFADFRCTDTIGGGHLAEINSKLSIPDTIAPGTYILRSCLDALNEIDEISKSNNCSEIMISIEKKAAQSTAYTTQPIFSSIKMYPNPTQEWIAVHGTLVNAQEHMVIEVKDFMGRVLSQQRLNSSKDLQYKMDVSSLSHGVYILEMTTKKGIWKQTFVKL